MGGTSTTSQTQQSSTNPWANAQPALGGILGQLQTGLGNTGVTGTENGAFNTLVNNANTGASTYAPQIGSLATSLLSGGGATDQAGNVTQNTQNYNTALGNGTAGYTTALGNSNAGANANLADLTQRLSPTANGANMGQNSGLQPYLDTLQNDITNSTNGQFAAAGRDFSGANSMALGRGITQGLAPVIAGQYNTDNQNRINAAQSLYDAGNTTNAFTTANAGAGYNAGRSAADASYGAGNTNAGILAGLQQQKLANQGQGVGVAGQAIDATNAGANAALQAEAQRRNIPVQALGLLAQIGIPIAGLGGTSTGSSQGSSTMSGAQQFGLIANGIGSMIPKGPISFGGGG